MGDYRKELIFEMQPGKDRGEQLKQIVQNKLRGKNAIKIKYAIKGGLNALSVKNEDMQRYTAERVATEAFPNYNLDEECRSRLGPHYKESPKVFPKEPPPLKPDPDPILADYDATHPSADSPVYKKSGRIWI